VIEPLSAREAARRAASPLSSELLADHVIVVDLRQDEATDLRPLAGIPRVVVGIGKTPLDEVDLIVADEQEAEQLCAVIDANPVAATTLVLHLRASAPLAIDHGLIAESAAYSTLQAGVEHQRWLRDRGQGSPKTEDERRVRVTRTKDHLHITLVRSEVRNAVDARMQQALVDALATADPDEPILLTGEGPVFSSGGDIDEFGRLADPATAHLLRLARSPARALARVGRRTTTIVQGACHGAGVELPAFTQRVVADPATTFTLPEVALGLIPGAGGTVSLPRRIGRHRTAWLALSGRSIDTATALTWGLIDEIRPA
jgi:hypothetical protein